MNAPTVVVRRCDEAARARLVSEGVHPVLARIYAARGIRSHGDLDTAFGALLPADKLGGCSRAAELLAEAIMQRQRLLIVADYDADGATACALAVSVLGALGAEVGYLVPNRLEHGYGLSPDIVELAARRQPHWIITVDNGIASVEGVARANELGMRVLVTDHHLPGEQLPEAACMVNPNLHGDAFPSKHLAGVGVMFYVLLALRTELRNRNWFSSRPEPNLANHLDLVALGTIADVVPLDVNNRVLVDQGLRRMRAGLARPGIAALFDVAGRDAARARSEDLGFAIGPRLNAAGRLTDMSLGIECLLSTDVERAGHLAAQLDELNRERRRVESTMQTSALEKVSAAELGDRFGLALYDESWHPGVVGILAARIREQLHRPVIAFAPTPDGELKGSGRSIPGLHLRDALDLLTKHYPGLVLKFGGHAMAAGLAIRKEDMPAFAHAFDTTIRSLLEPADLAHRIEVDGTLETDDISLEFVHHLDKQVWGQGFAAPSFVGEFDVLEQRVVGGRHLKLKLKVRHANKTVDAIRFGDDSPLPAHVECVFRLQANEYNGSRSLQLVVEHAATSTG